MIDRFEGKTWIFWAQAIFSGSLGAFSVIGGISFLTGLATDQFGRRPTAAIAPLLIIGTLLVGWAVMAASNIIQRRHPLIRCFREGIEFRLIGKTALAQVPIFRQMEWLWALLSRQGFKSNRRFMLWLEFQNASVTGFDMALALVIQGVIRNESLEALDKIITFQHHELRKHPEIIATTLNVLAHDANLQNSLPMWVLEQRAKPGDFQS